LSEIIIPKVGKSGPTINKGKSKQDYQTPPEFIEAVVARFGPITFDLAADEKNAQAPNYFTKEQNSLVQDWGKLEGNLWLNPEFADITPWAEKCKATTWPQQKANLRILFLVPGSVGSEWYRNHVHGHAYVLGLAPRLTFVGCKDAYPKDCILGVFGHGMRGFDTWRWKE
jgi:phage N-6-adenine-methyltransferase